MAQCKLSRTLNCWKPLYETYLGRSDYPQCLLAALFGLSLNLERMNDTSQWIAANIARIPSSQHYGNYCFHPLSGTHSALIDVGKSGLFSACVSCLSFSWPSPLKGHDTPLPGSPQGASAPSPPHSLCRQMLSCVHLALGEQVWHDIHGVLCGHSFDIQDKRVEKRGSQKMDVSLHQTYYEALRGWLHF